MLVKVGLSLGSNIDRRSSLKHGLDDLKAAFGNLTCSPVYESEAVGFKGDPFLNLVVSIETSLPLKELTLMLKNIEAENGRVRVDGKMSSRTLDIDVVTYGDFAGVMDGVELPRPELYKSPYVYVPMADVFGDSGIPGDSISFNALAARLSTGASTLTKISFSWS